MIILKIIFTSAIIKKKLLVRKFEVTVYHFSLSTRNDQNYREESKAAFTLYSYRWNLMTVFCGALQEYSSFAFAIIGLTRMSFFVN